MRDRLNSDELQVRLAATTYAWALLVRQLARQGLDTKALMQDLRTFSWGEHPLAEQAHQAMQGLAAEWERMDRAFR
ncbi:TPA: hypothetical protein L4U31_002831 [Pseudomonas aeruginosa]|nr:hypothetical protein [Pseudomonas aeruginosa]